MISVYQGKIISLGLETAELPNGRELELEIVRHPGGAAAVALDHEGRVCLIRQYRHAAGGWLWELPAGKIDGGEDPLETAKRELAEEVGVAAARWCSLGYMHSSPGVFDEVVHLYLARGLDHVGQALGADELLEVHWLPLPQALRWAEENVVTDAKSVIGLLRAAAWMDARIGSGKGGPDKEKIA